MNALIRKATPPNDPDPVPGRASDPESRLKRLEEILAEIAVHMDSPVKSDLQKIPPLVAAFREIARELHADLDAAQKKARRPLTWADVDLDKIDYSTLTLDVAAEVAKGRATSATDEFLRLSREALAKIAEERPRPPPDRKPDALEMEAARVAELRRRGRLRA